VLVVEDNADGREMLTMLLALDGHEVRTAATGAEALAVAAELRPEAAIVDIGLPDIDGYSIARALRAFYGEGLRLIALTGYGSESDRRKAIEAGFDVFVVKPVDPLELARALDPQAAAPGGRSAGGVPAESVGRRKEERRPVSLARSPGQRAGFVTWTSLVPRGKALSGCRALPPPQGALVRRDASGVPPRRGGRAACWAVAQGERRLRGARKYPHGRRAARITQWCNGGQGGEEKERRPG
jgi:CheY-like chemotaxis protein